MTTRWIAGAGARGVASGATIAEAVMAAIGTPYMPAGRIRWPEGSLYGRVCDCLVGPDTAPGGAVDGPSGLIHATERAAIVAIYGTADRADLRLIRDAEMKAEQRGEPVPGQYYHRGVDLAARLAEIQAACDAMIS